LKEAEVATTEHGPVNLEGLEETWDDAVHKRSRSLQELVPGYAVLDLRVTSAQQTGYEPRREASPDEGADFTFGTVTLGGLRTNVVGEVLNPSGVPIAGLVAAGRATSGLATYGYCGGISPGGSTFFGRRAGAAAGQRSTQLAGV
jgi:3-oxo-5alpha-steroid 4-dehydrogenase